MRGRTRFIIIIVVVSFIVNGGNRELTVLENEGPTTVSGCLDVPAKHCCLVYYIMFARRGGGCEAG